MGSEKAKQFQQFFQLTRLTMNFEFEAIEHQHLVPLHEDKLVAIGFTGIHIEGRVLHPIFTKLISTYFGFPHVFDQDRFVWFFPFLF